ncbi:MAG: ATP-dependent sacrificial sulfur transferase LarE [Verrucomicrobiota bacterium]
MQAPLERRYGDLRARLSRLEGVAVAFSGGVDSAFLMHEAHAVLGDGAVAAVADSPSLPRAELRRATGLARERGWRLEVMATRELENESYARNPLNRCYFCKQEMFARLASLARRLGLPAIAYGENADDWRDDRPSRPAAREFAVLAPLQQAGLRKAEIRELSRRAGLPTHDLPAAPCLASRLPTGRRVTRPALARVEAGEALLRAAGLVIVRLRDHGESAAVEVGPQDLPRLADEALRRQLARKLRQLGYRSVAFRETPYRGAGLR